VRDDRVDHGCGDRDRVGYRRSSSRSLN
jgi:hypothetical protein